MTIEYDKPKAASYWDKRLLTTKSQLRAVGYFAKAKIINLEYTLWEQNVIYKVINKLNPSIAVDLGCGVGRLSSVFRKLKSINKLYLIDLSPAMLDSCKDKFSKIKKFQNIQLFFLNNSSDHVEIKNNSIDFIMCMGIFEHLPQQMQEATIKEMHRILKTSSHCLLEVNNSNSIFLQSKQINTNQFRVGKQLDNGYFCGIVALEYILQLLQKYHFKIINIFSNPLFSFAINNLNQDYNNLINLKKVMQGIHQYDLYHKQNIVDKYADQLVLEIRKIQ